MEASVSKWNLLEIRTSLSKVQPEVNIIFSDFFEDKNYTSLSKVKPELNVILSLFFMISTISVQVKYSI